MAFGSDQPFQRSPFTQVVREGDWAVIWHSLFGYPQIVSADTLELLNLFTTPSTLSSKISDDLTEDEQQGVKALLLGYFIVPEGFDDRAHLQHRMQQSEETIADGSRIKYLELIMSEVCNFRCIYCIHYGNLEGSDRTFSPDKFMQFETAKDALDLYIAVLREHGRKIAEVNFGGGEPLFAWPTIKRVLEYCYETYGKEFEFRFSINTNAVLVTPAIAETLKEFHVEIASSLDGLQEGNDLVRQTKSGQGTFREIVTSFDILAEAGYPLSGFSVTITKENFGQLDESVIDWALARGMTEVRIDIDVIGMVEVPVSEVAEKLMRIRHYAAKLGVNVPGFWARPAENLNESTLDEQVAFCGAVRGNSMCVSPSGGIYACGYSAIQLGTIAQFESFSAPGGGYHQLVRNRLTGRPAMCQGCMIEGQCGGGCQITQEFAQDHDMSKIQRMCDFYRLMTQEILRELLLQEAEKT